MDDKAFNEELSRWLLRPPGASIGDVIEKILAAPPETQERVKDVVARILGEPAPSAENKLTLDCAVGFAVAGFSLLLAAWEVVKIIRLRCEIDLGAGKCTESEAAAALRSAIKLYRSTERLFGPLVDVLFKFLALDASFELDRKEEIDQIRDGLFKLELDVDALTVSP